MHGKRIIISLFILSNLIHTIHARNYYFRQYRNEDGLSHNTVLCSMQDRRGFMWFGTKDGISRFDGHTFKIFQYEPDDTLGLCSNYINCFHEDKEGLIWIGTNNGVCYYNPKYDRFVRLNEILHYSRDIIDVRSDDQDNIWIQTFNGFFKYIKKEKKLKHYPPHVYFSSKKFCTDASGTLWLASADSLYKYNPLSDNFTGYPIMTQQEKNNFSSITDIADTGGYGILLSTERSGLKLFNPDTGRLETFLTSDQYGKTIYMRTILCYSPEEYWIGSESGIYIFNIRTGEARNIRRNPANPYSLGDNAIYTLTRDTEGGVWAGTYFRGVSYLPKEYTPFQKILNLKQPGNIRGEVIREIKQDHFGNLWIGTEDAGLNKYDARTGTFTHFFPDGQTGSISGSNIHGLMADGNRLWIGYYEEGVDILDIPSQKVIKHYSAGNKANDLKTNFVVTITQTSDRKILLGTLVGVYEYDPETDGFIYRYDLAPHSFIYCILEDKHQNIWVGTLGRGMFLRTKEGKVINYQEIEGDTNSISSNAITDIFEDSKNRIWVSTRGNGFCEFHKETGKFTRYTKKESIPSNIIYKILEDNQKMLWFSSPKGLSHFNPVTRQMKNYSRLHGLTDDQFNYNSGYKDPSGKLYFGTINGMVTFTPENFEENIFEPPVYITGFQVSNTEATGYRRNSSEQKSIIYMDEIILPYDQSTFSIDFAALSYTAPEMNEYQYLLEGVDKDWTHLKTYRKVYYTNIPPGTYVFRLKASNSNGIWTFKEKTLRITITPPLWKTPWAYALYIFICLCFIFLALRAYTRRLKIQGHIKLDKLEDLKQKEILSAKIEFFTNIAHEIRTPLTLIKAPIDKIIKSGEASSSILKDLIITQTNTNRLLELSNQLLDFRKTEKESMRLNFVRINIRDILNETFVRFTPIANERNLEFTLHAPDNICEADVDREALTKILSNLFTNALKFADSIVEIVLITSSVESIFYIRIDNDGNRIPSEMKEKIFEPFFQYEGSHTKVTRQGTGIGLYLARSLAEMHKGKLYLDTSIAGLNSFVLELPRYHETTIHLNREKVIRSEQESKPALSGSVEKTDSRPIILIVEDIKEMLDFIAEELSSLYRVIKASNGEEALSILDKYNINLIISDIVMPTMNGFELCKRLKSDIIYSHIPFILLTAKYNIQTQIESLELGADAYIGKPFNTDHLLAQISNLLKKRNVLMETFAKSPFSFSSTIASTKTDETFLKTLNEIIFEKIADPDLNVDHLSELLGMSPSSLYRKMKGVCDMNPNEFIRITRLKRAATLLIESDLSMKEIAYLTGFSSPSYFSASFMKQFGIKPSDFVKKHKNKL